MILRLASFLRARWISVLALLVLAVAWEVAAHLSPKSPLRGTPLVPSFEFMFGQSLLGMSDYWRIDMWAPMPIVGGEQTYLGAFLALGYHSALTIARLASGLVLGAVGGTLLGLAVSWSLLLRKLAAAPGGAAADAEAPGDVGQEGTSGAGPETTATAGIEASPAGASRPAPSTAAVEPIDLLESAGPAVLKRLAPLLAAVLLAVLVLRRRRTS